MSRIMSSVGSLARDWNVCYEVPCRKRDRMSQSNILRNSRKECQALVLRDYNGGSKSSMVKVIVLHHAVENSKPCAKGYLLLHSDE